MTTEERLFMKRKTKESLFGLKHLLITLISLLIMYNASAQLQLTPEWTSTSEDVPVTINVLLNDITTGTQIDSQSMQVVVKPMLGKDSITSDFMINYMPFLNESGIDSFMYQVCDTGISPKCDSTWVHVFIKSINDPPVAVDDHITTGINLPVPIKPLNNDYDVDGAIDSGTLKIVSSPKHGLPSFNSNLHLIYYTPDNNFVGMDTIKYGISDILDASLKDTGIIIISVIDSCNPVVCVWPGDANNNGIVNNIDLLYVGLAFGKVGVPRNSPSINYLGQFATNWITATPKKSNTNFKYADTDGSGTVDVDDSTAIQLNYNQVHNKTSDFEESSESIIWIDISDDTVMAGDTVQGNILLGNDTAILEHLYGYALTMSYENQYIDSGSIRTDFTGNWIAPSNDYLSLERDFYSAGNTDLAFSRTNQQGMSGYGLIAKISFIIDNIDGKLFSTEVLNIGLNNVFIIDEDGKEIQVESGNDSIVVKFTQSGLNDPATNSEHLLIYPNPANDYLNIAVEHGYEVLSYQVSNALGQTLEFNDQNTQNKFTLDMHELPIGMYVLQINTQFGSMNKQILINR